jgi:hypothetical protein
MLSEYIQKALEKARYKVLEDGTWFAEIPDFEGVRRMPPQSRISSTSRSLGRMAGAQNKRS